MLASLSRRVRRAELMDDPRLDPADHRRALAGLARINRVSRPAAGLWRPIERLAREQSRTLRVLDVATGSGDTPLGLWKRAARSGLRMEVVGCDISPTAVAAARERAKELAAPVTFFEHDVLKADLPTGFDVVTCSLFLHHLDEPDAILLLQRMDRAARRLALVSDLDRSRMNYVLVWLASYFVGRTRVVRHDGPTSLRAAFTRAEALALADRAGLKGVTASSQFPARFLLPWGKP
jgi:2-polyprenyl-3-methyl-5-hydroxy-6-metoxy-1,4-benzoquinol methylase